MAVSWQKNTSLTTVYSFALFSTEACSCVLNFKAWEVLSGPDGESDTNEPAQGVHKNTMKNQLWIFSVLFNPTDLTAPPPPPTDLTPSIPPPPLI